MTDRASALSRLRELLPPGSVCYTIRRHTSRSGGTVVVSVLAQQGREWAHLSADVAAALDLPHDGKRNGVRVAITANGLIRNLATDLHGSPDSLRQEWL
jgi:hypothetical protein